MTANAELYLIRSEEEFGSLAMPCSLFVCADGSEERSTAAAGKIPFAPGGRVLVFDFRLASGEPLGGQHRTATLNQNLGARPIRREVVRLYDTASLGALVEQEVRPDDVMWLDFTALPTPELAILLRQLFDRGKRDLIATYTFPVDYPPWRDDATRLYEPSGESVRALDGFGGLSEGRERLLVVQLGFEGERALGVTTELDAKPLPVLGFPPLRPGWDQRSRTENARLLLQSGGHVEMAPSDDVVGNRLLLDALARKHGPNFDMSIAPFGTKPQTVGAVLHALRRPATRIVYDFPSGVSTEYSTGVGQTLAYKLNL